MRLTAGIMVLCALAAGCGSVSGPGAPESVTHNWIGTFSTGGDSGNLSLDVVQTGDDATGEIVFSSPAVRPPVHLLVRGTIRQDEVHLALDTTKIPYQYTFTLDAVVDVDSQLTGTLTYSPTGLNAGVACRRLDRGAMRVEATVNLDIGVKALVFDGTYLWLSTIGDDHIRMNTEGDLVDQVVVLWDGDKHWTSGALAFDGTHLWGFLPGTIMDPGGPRDYSEMIEFDRSGRIVSNFRVSHRTSGLAYDGGHLWSLNGTTRKLYEFEPPGTLLDSIAIDVPDPYHLEFDGGSYWCTSWYMHRLYNIDASGRAVAIYELPEPSPLHFKSGLAFDGTSMWYALGNPFDGYSRLHRLTLD